MKDITTEEAAPLADMLLKLSEQIRSGAVKITGISQSRDYDRVYDRITGKYEYFQTKPVTFSITYQDEAWKQAEHERLAQYMAENPHLELIG